MSERGAASSERAGRLLIAVLLAVGSALVATFGFFFFRDNFATHYPFKVVSAAAWRTGSIPWWNPTDGGGQPLAGNPNALTFYPDNILYLLLPAHVAFNLHFLLHLVLGWFAMRALIQSHSPSPRRSGEKVPEGRMRGRSFLASTRDSSSGAAMGAPAFGATLWVLSGAVISALAFYNLVTAVALIPFALWAAQRRSALVYGGAFGLLILGTEPMTVVATAMAVALVAFDVKRIALAIPVAVAIASPQIVAYSEIAREVERANGYSARTVLNASFDPRRIAEVLIGPLLHLDAPHLFPSLLLGVIVFPALFRRSRWTVAAAAMLFFALGRFNPLVRGVVEAAPWLRFARYPEKFALPLCAVLVVLAAAFFEETKAKRLWAAITFLPLVGWAIVTIPLDWWSPYALPQQPPVRAFVEPLPGGQDVDRATYRTFAQHRVPLFGATAGLRYVLNRSGDGMHSTLSRIVAERYAATHAAGYRRIALELPMAMVVPRTIGVRSVNEAVTLIESGTADTIAPRAFLSAPGVRVTSYREYPDRIEIGLSNGRAGGGERRAGGSEGRAGGIEGRAGGIEGRAGGSEQRTATSEQRTATSGQRPATSDQRTATSEQRPASSEQRAATSDQRTANSEQRPATSEQRTANSDERPANSEQRPATSDQRPATSGSSVLFVNQSYFTAWDTGGLPIVPLDIDRLGVLVPDGVQQVTLRFGRHRTLVVAAWVISSALLLAVLLALRVEKRDGGAGQVERPADEDGAV
jgi:hypothetical protein